MAYTVGVLECSTETIFVMRSKSQATAILDDKREGWPETQVLPHRSSVCAEKLEVKTTW